MNYCLRKKKKKTDSGFVFLCLFAFRFFFSFLLRIVIKFSQSTNWLDCIAFATNFYVGTDKQYSHHCSHFFFSLCGHKRIFSFLSGGLIPVIMITVINDRAYESNLGTNQNRSFHTSKLISNGNKHNFIIKTFPEYKYMNKLGGLVCIRLCITQLDVNCGQKLQNIYKLVFHCARRVFPSCMEPVTNSNRAINIKCSALTVSLIHRVQCVQGSVCAL